MKEHEQLIGKIIFAIAIILASLILANSIKYGADRIKEGLMQQTVFSTTNQ